MHVLSVDLASKDPSDLGIAVLRAGEKISVELVPPQVLQLAKPLHAPSVADALIELAEARQCRWIALDGPSGWKDPDNGLVHSRVCDKELNAPAKVGLPGQVKPHPYTAFIQFSVSLFDALGDRGYARLAATSTPSDRTSVEILPLVCWPRLNLPRLPAKAKCKPPSLGACTDALSSLVTFESVPRHDELQATVAGVAVLWRLLGRNERVCLAGRPSVLLDGHWREGYIVAPSNTLPKLGPDNSPQGLTAASAGRPQSASSLPPTAATTLPPVAVVLGFVDRINRRDLEGLVAMMSSDHRLEVLEVEPVVGRATNEAAWRGYLTAFPRYVIHPHRINAEGDLVAILGHTTGSHLGLPDAEEQELLAIWLASVRDQLVERWCVIEDTVSNRKRFGLDD